MNNEHQEIKKSQESKWTFENFKLKLTECKRKLKEKFGVFTSYVKNFFSRIIGK